MKQKLYPFILLCSLLAASLLQKAGAQNCAGLQFSATSAESRCISTGSITIYPSGGSGNYNYKAIGPVTTPFTSSSTITGLQAGSYRVVVKDVASGCIVEKENIEVTGSYSDPRFQLSKTDATCAGNDGTITAGNLQYGRSPFSYSIIAPSPAGVGATNTTGHFTNLVAGEYSVQLQDSCGGIQVRRITIESYSWWFDNYTITRNGCDSADAQIFIRDNKGNQTSQGAPFTGFRYGVVRTPGDTSWFTTNSFRFYIGKLRSVTVVAKDPCGTLHKSAWNLPAGSKPSVGSVATSGFSCGSFNASLGGAVNLTSPSYCLYNSAGNSLLSCNSTGTFTNLPYGAYCIKVTDACYDTTITRCFTVAQPKPSAGSSVSINDRTCTTFSASIWGQANFTDPEYCLYNAANELVRCNTNGVFKNLPYGAYCIKVTDACYDTTITRCFSSNRAMPALTGTSISGSTCSTFNVNATGMDILNGQYCLYDAEGNLITCNTTGSFTGLPHGSYCVRAISQCGDSTNTLCFSSKAPAASVSNNVAISKKTCSYFTATITGQTNLVSAQYCIYNSSNTLVKCNTTGVFDSLAYGAYCIRIKDGCQDTTITRCFTQNQAVPSVTATMQQTNATCATFSARVTGTNLTSPRYYLYDSTNTLKDSNTTGQFNSLPYGRYCVDIRDGCVDTTFRVCQTFNPVKKITLNTSKSCSIGQANIDVQFSSTNSPYSILVYNPNGTLVYSTSTGTATTRLLLPALSAGQKYKVVGADQCGNTDSSLITPDASVVNKTITAQAKCPSASWQNGSGSLSVTCSSNLGAMYPLLVKKNGAAISKSYSSQSGNQFQFSDLEPATYIVEYSVQNCSSRLYDTFALQPYTYPSQGRSAIYQCDNNSFSLGADVYGGIGPYNFQIIGSMPESPSIVSPQQNSPIFTINNGTTYSLVRLRTIDACGNATLNDVSVLPLQNIVVTADAHCFYNNITLSVDTIPNATYEWYRKTSDEDSSFVGSEINYNLPFFRPEEVGTYVCKVNVNSNCIVRFASYELNGECHETLPVAGRLKGKTAGSENRLTWSADSRMVSSCVVERKAPGEGSYRAISGKVHPSQGTFTDNDPAGGTNLYRLRLTYADGKPGYSNVVQLKGGQAGLTVYPNPVQDAFQVTISGGGSGNYRVELVSLAGQVVQASETGPTDRTSFRLARGGQVRSGVYMVKVTDKVTGVVRTHKLLFR